MKNLRSDIPALAAGCRPHTHGCRRRNAERNVRENGVVSLATAESPHCWRCANCRSTCFDGDKSAMISPFHNDTLPWG
ncbi:hypothetical protein KCP73_21620 [Salmonella enterica subsp. enterica]|nr:hypothetical protein KCP73_21620 [Salmonella enterica subsp. enterica]